MTALAEAYKLEELLALLFKAEKWLVDDIDRTFPIRLFRQGRRSGAEPVLASVFNGLGKALADNPDLSRMMRRFDRAYDEVLARTAHREVALRKLAKERAKWQSTKKAMAKKDPSGTEELIAWIDRDIEERLAIARRRGRPAHAVAPTKAKKPTKKLTKAEAKAAKQAEAAAIRRAEEQARRTYEAFVTAMTDSDPDTFLSFAKLAAYFKHDDPVWGRIAEKVAASGSANKAINAIQGVLGEALAMRNAWVVDSIVRATERADQLAGKLGADWEVVYTQLPVFAGTRSGGMGELYDASIWLVKKSAGVEGEVLDAAPVFVLQVKSGVVSEAAEQMRKDFTRELGDRVRLPAATGEQARRDYRINNLQALLRREGVKPSSAAVGELTTQRVLVAPRPPSDTSIHRNLPPATAIEYVEGLLERPKIKRCSEAIAKALRGK
jgi:hypothetical protein